MSPLQAQNYPYEIQFVEGSYEKQTTITGISDSSSFLLQINGVRNELFSKGHLLANIDQIEVKDSLYAKIFVGPKYYWHSLGVQNIPEEYLSKAGYRLKDFNNATTDIKEFNRLITKLLDQATNAGYPFARFQLTQIEVENKSVSGFLDYQPGPIIKYDTLTIVPENLVRARFLEAHLDVRKGDLFSNKSVNAIESTIQRLSFVKLIEPIQVDLENNLCNISVGLEKVRSNRFDALVGFLPNQGENGGLRITGYADLHLENLFRSGKSLTFQWQQFQPLSQKLLLKYNHPNLLRSPIGLELEADLIRQDSLFLNTSIAFDIFYSKNNFQFSAITNLISARQLSTPADTMSVPVIGDYTLNLFGVNLEYDRMDNQNNSRSGFKLGSSIKIGGKSIRKNSTLPESVYDSISLTSTQIEFDFTVEKNFSLGKSFVLHTDFQMGSVLNNDRLFVNDLIRLGGVNSLRGFNELDLFVSSYGLLRLELQLLMDEASKIFLFYDQSYTYNDLSKISDAPLGFGAGLQLRTGGGDLQLIYALGVSQEQSLSLDQSKIHLGYVASF